MVDAPLPCCGTVCVQVSIHMVRAVVGGVERVGCSRERFLARIGVDPEYLDRSDTWLSVAEFRRVVRAALEVSDDPAFGLHLGEQASSVMFQMLAHVTLHAATLGEAMEMIARYTSLIAPGLEPRMIVLGERVVLRFPFLAGNSLTVRVMAELAMTGLLRLLRQYLGENAYPERVCFAYPKPARADEYARVFQGREQFGQPVTELQLPAAWSTRSQLHADPELHFLLKSHAERQLTLRERGATIPARLERLLEASDHRALPSMASAARALGVSSRTVARRLRDEGVTFAELVAKRRLCAAQRLLELRVLTVHEIAEAMGFADAPAFHKAFKRWSGLTPMQYVTSVRTKTN